MQDLVTLLDIKDKLPKQETKNKEKEKTEKPLNLKNGSEAEIRGALVKYTGYGAGLVMKPTFVSEEAEDGKITKTHDGYLIKINQDQTVHEPLDDNWGSLKVRGRLSDFTQSQWNKIIFSFISDKNRQRERLEKLSATGDVQLNRINFIENNIVNYGRVGE
jgi:hypothetical protein